jgi:hypothetical protein
MEATLAAPARRTREAKNAKFANDGSYKSVEALLQKIAGQCYARAEKLGLGLDFDDVLQTMNLAYCKAKAKWNPEGGALFSTYCQTVCFNTFNASIEREVNDITTMGLISYDVAFPREDEESDDPLESRGDLTASVEDQMVLSDEIRVRMACLSLSARRLITVLLAGEREPTMQARPRLREMANEAGISKDELKRVKLEILKTFGVKWF